MYPLTMLLNTLLGLHLFHFSTSIDTITANYSITANHSIRDGELIFSSGELFALGFFSPGKSPKRYVGIWYYQDPEQTVVWVANRDDAITGRSGVLSINSHGNLVLYETNQTTVPVWSTNVSVTARNGTAARLLDSGNLELFETGTTNILWQSFDHPTHTGLPLMKLGLNRRTGLNSMLTSWKSQDDPGSGNYSYRIDLDGLPQLLLYNGSAKWWRTGSWTGKKLTGTPEMTPYAITNYSFVNDQYEVYMVYCTVVPSMLVRLTVSEVGYLQHFVSTNRGLSWIKFWYSLNDPPCDYYGYCGANSNCKSYPLHHEFECTCLPGFEPKYPQERYSGNGSSGCTRKHGMSACQRGKRFEKVERVKVPDTSVARVDMSLDLKACKDRCLSDCSCIAYTSAHSETNEGMTGCLTYRGEMMDTRFYPNGGQDLYVRVADQSDVSHRKKAIVGIVMASFCAMLIMIASTTWFFRRKRWEKAREHKISSSSANSTNFDESLRRKEQDLPLLDLRTITTATNNFSFENKLGEGGFGPVYKTNQESDCWIGESALI